MSILRRMILFELLKVFSLSLVALTGLLLMAGLVSEMSQRGLSPEQIFAVIPLLIPSTLPYTLPATTLFATCVVYGRLAADNEILALRAAGVHLRHAVWPGILLGLAASIVTVILYFEVIPQTHHLLRSRILSDVEEYLYSVLKREGRLAHTKLDYVIYVRRIQGRKLQDAQFMRKDPKKQHYDVIARAREAELRVDLARKQVLVDMRYCHIVSDNGEQRAFVESKVWPVDLPPDFWSQAKIRASDMTWEELRDEQDKVADRLEHLQTERALHEAAIASGSAPPHYPGHVNDLKNQELYQRLLARSVKVELHMRPALALGCLCFVLVGCPVGIWFSRSDYLSAFITCFLPIVFLYYPLILCGINLAKADTIEPVVAVWAADAFLGTVALVLLRRLFRS